MKQFLLVLSIFLLPICSIGQSGFSLVDRPNKKQVDVLFNGKLLTAYCYYDSIAKPFLYPVNTVDGITVTRGFPIAPRPGERSDHPHHVGIWLNYESVNGIDFWNNSTAIAKEKKDLYGTILHEKIVKKKSNKNKAELITRANWHNNKAELFLKELSTYQFHVKHDVFIIDRTTTLTAQKNEVVFRDVKDGFFAIRVARELEMPSDKEDEFVDVHGNITKVVPAGGVATGMYYSANGLRGDSVWSSKANWAVLKGKKDGSSITIAMFDNPKNPGYPTYWHARGYGLFALNPLGRKVFSKGKEELNLSISKEKSVSFKYRIVIASKDLSVTDLENLALDFIK